MIRCVLALLLVAYAVASGMPGGLTDARPATADDQAIADQVKQSVVDRVGENFADFTVVSVKTQVVAGVNYFMKIAVGGDQYIHIRVFKALPHQGSYLKVTGIRAGKTLEDPIDF